MKDATTIEKDGTFDSIVLETRENLRSLALSPEASLLDALKTIESGTRQVALSVCEDGTLRGLITDGDIRRALVGGASLSSPVEGFLTKNFVSVPVGTGRAEALDLMQSLRLSHLPILGEGSMLEGLHFLSELISPTKLRSEALILAGGKGTRLRPLTEDIPKPLLKVAGRPILERLILHLAGHGIRKIHLATNYLGHMVEEHFGDGSQLGCEIEYLKENEPLGTAGPLRLLKERPKYPMVVLNGDLVTEIDVLRLLEHHVRQTNTLTMGVRVYAHRIPFGCVELEGQRVRSLSEKPVLTKLINTGVYVLDPNAFDALPESGPCQMPELITSLIERGEPVGTYQTYDDWTDVGEFNSLKMARGGGPECP